MGSAAPRQRVGSRDPTRGSGSLPSASSSRVAGAGRRRRRSAGARVPPSRRRRARQSLGEPEGEAPVDGHVGAGDVRGGVRGEPDGGADMSSVSPSRAIGTESRAILASRSAWRKRRLMSVMTQPGVMALARTPAAPHSSARTCVKLSTPAFAAVYAARAGQGRLATTEAALTTRAPPAGHHRAARRTAEPEHARQVQVDQALPALIAQLEDRGVEDRASGVVHQHVIRPGAGESGCGWSRIGSASGEGRRPGLEAEDGGLEPTGLAHGGASLWSRIGA